MEIPAVFNNSGALVLERDPSAAWDLFKGALEVRLASEKLSCTFTFADAPTEEYRKLVNNNVYVFRADHHIRQLEKQYGVLEDLKKDLQTPMVSKSSATFCPDVCPEDGSYVPYVFCRPLQIPQTCRFKGTEAQASSAAIILNLAMVEHRFGSRCASGKLLSPPMALYKLASSLIGNRFSTLYLVLLNNASCLYYESGDLISARRCTKVMSSVLQQKYQGDDRDLFRLGHGEIEDLTSNIMWISYTSYAASPAA